MLRLAQRAKTSACSRSLESDTDCDEKAAIYRGDLQLDALKQKGCVRIFTDKFTGTKFAERKALQKALAYLNEGDTLVVWKLDRFGRSMVDLVNTITNLSRKNISFVSLTENIDTTTAVGKMFLQFLAMLAEFERNLISERTKAGLDSARARGRKGGRPVINVTRGKPLIALKMYDEGTTDIEEICKTLHISRATLFRWKKLREEQKSRQDTPLPDGCPLIFCIQLSMSLLRGDPGKREVVR